MISANRRKFLAATGATAASIGAVFFSQSKPIASRKGVSGRAHLGHRTARNLGGRLQPRQACCVCKPRSQWVGFSQQEPRRTRKPPGIRFHGGRSDRRDRKQCKLSSVFLARRPVISWSHLKKPTFSTLPFVVRSVKKPYGAGAIGACRTLRVSGPVEGASFQHVDAGGDATFVRAALRGLFVEVNFNGANLKETEFFLFVILPASVTLKLLSLKLT